MAIVTHMTRVRPAKHAESRSGDKGRTRKTKAGPDVSGDKGRTRKELKRPAIFLEHSMKYFVGNVDVESFFAHRHISTRARP